jgi:hypothetical protein
MPRKKSQSSGNKPLPANQQKGKKVCTCCHEEKNLTDFYYSSSPMYSLDERIPVCKECCKTSVLSEDGKIDFDKFKDLLRNIDKPLYFDLLFSSEESVKKENSYLSDEEVSLHGYEILQKYFTLVAMRQDKAKSYSDAEKEGFIHQNSNRTKREKDEILNRYSHLINQCLQNNKVQHVSKQNQNKHYSNVDNFEVTDNIKDLFGDGYTTVEYKKMYEKYEKLKLNYTLQTNLHQEALATYVRFKVKEEMATAAGNVDEAKKWYDAAQNAASNGKLTPKQLSAADLQKGVNSFSELTLAIEQATDVINILPKYKTQPHDAPDFNIYCYISYARKLKGLPPIEYKDIYKFYDDKMEEYLRQYGDPNGVFTEANDTMLKNRPNIEKFIVLPSDYDDLSDESEDDADE